MKLINKLFSRSKNVTDYKKFLGAMLFYVIVSVLAGLSGYVLCITPIIGFIFPWIFGVTSSVYALVGVIMAFVSFAKNLTKE